MDADALRAQFPVLSRVAYFNAGTDGPLPAVAHTAAAGALVAQAEEGRAWAHFEVRADLQDALRAGYARAIGAAPEAIALTTSTTDGLGRVLAGLDLGAGDEIVTSDQEHPGLLGPLIAARARGATVRVAPFARVADAVGPATTLVAVSHVSWISGEVAPAALAELDVPVVLDGAQGAGAVPVDPAALGCAAYAAPGQKWLCGADGTGFVWMDPGFVERVTPVAPGYTAFEDAALGLDGHFRADAGRHDTPALAREVVALSLAALGVLEDAGWADVHAAACDRAERLADALRERDRTVAPRGRCTLVAWEDPGAEATSERLLGAGIVLRSLPGGRLLRASVGAWNDDADVGRLLGAL